MTLFNIRHFLASLLAAGLSSLATAQAPVAMVLSVDGEVSVEVSGKSSKLEPFTRLLEGDRIKLGKPAHLNLVYPRNGRQENWAGSGVILTGSTESTAVNGKLQVDVKQLPAKIAQMMAHTPASDSTGKAGMVRLRNIPQPDELASLEKTYQELRLATPAADRSPEIYFLAGLYKLGEHDRLRNALVGLEGQYPNDPAIQMLGKLYMRAINNMDQPQR